MKHSNIFWMNIFLFAIVLLSNPAVSRLSYASWEERRSKVREPREEKVKYVKSKYGLKALMALSKSQEAMVRALNDETRNFDAVVKCLDDGKIDIGNTEQEVIDICREPVVIIPDDVSHNSKWLYKPGTESFFGEHKIYLIFNPEGILIDWYMPDESDESL